MVNRYSYLLLSLLIYSATSFCMDTETTELGVAIEEFLDKQPDIETTDP